MNRRSGRRTMRARATAARRYGDAPLPRAMRTISPSRMRTAIPPPRPAYEQDGYEHAAHQQVEEEYYEDVPPSRRRLGVMAIAGVFALAVIGTAGAFGYRALFGSSGSRSPPPVIKADAAPSKIVPATTGKDAQSSKTDHRPDERAGPERKAGLARGTAGRQAGNGRAVAISTAGGASVAAWSRASRRKSAPSPSAPISRRPPTPAIRRSELRLRLHERCRRHRRKPRHRAAAPPLARASADSGDGATRSRTSQRLRQCVRRRLSARPHRPPRNAPLSLNPNAAPARAPAPAAPTRTAVAARRRRGQQRQRGRPAVTVQVSSQRSEAEAQAAFRSLQAKYPSQLGGRQPLDPQGRSGRQGDLLPGHGRALRHRQRGQRAVLEPQGGRRQCLVQRN